MNPFKAGMFVKPTADVGRNLEVIQELDEIGLQTAWQTNNVLWPDPLAFYAAVAATTGQIRLGTSVIQIYPRHPTALVSQAQVIEGMAPGRLRLGVGTSHRPRMEKNLGIPMGKPLTYLREYVTVLRGLLWEGGVEFHGEYLNVSESYPDETPSPKTEISISALSPNSYRLAGEIADAAISWVSPISYLVDTALPALQEGATAAGRE
jgi:alkanesulfonate monooxygenase SsuD/methylene tetrahydromethanopterin reductase-like flavin-dependent oxidoreductase (luciferase family)